MSEGQGGCEQVCIFKTTAMPLGGWRPGHSSCWPGSLAAQPLVAGSLKVRQAVGRPCFSQPLPENGRQVLNTPCILLSYRLKALAATGRKTVEEASDW